MAEKAQSGNGKSGQLRPVKLRHRLEYLLYLILRTAARLVGGNNLSRLGSLIGAISNKLVTRRTKLAHANLAMICPEMSEAERDRIVRACWIHFCRMMLEYVRDSGLPFDEIAAPFEVEGRENMDAALALGRGVLALSAHFGSWEAALSAFGAFDRKITIVGRVLDNPLLHRELYEGRTRAGFEVLDRRSAARDLIRAINEKAIIILLVDQAVQSHEGEPIPFLGKPAWTTTAPARMAIRSNVPICTVFTYPSIEGRRPRIVFEPIIVPDELPAEEKTPAALTGRINDRISARIREYPELWLWFHDRWKEG